MITVDDGGGGGEGGKNCQNVDYVICERPLSEYQNYAILKIPTNILNFKWTCRHGI